MIKTLTARERVIVALDVAERSQAEALVATLGDTVGFYKIGMQLQYAGGIELARELAAAGKRVFLDAKLYDIEATVRGAVGTVARLGVDFLTIHGTVRTIRAAVEGRQQQRPQLLAVTVLTSLDQQDIADLGFPCTVADLVLARARAAVAAGCDGVVASGHEAAAIRAMAGDRLIIVTPGIRLSGSPTHDQKRVMTPAEAIAAGADYLVVGRDITAAADPREAAQRVVADIERGLAGISS
ncbi:Orotidine 5'-phosphate decarboxylase [uncultured Gammaproteobacteria bacterium]